MLTSKGIIRGLQLKIIELFQEVAEAEQFYLSGGTALADFYLGHRESYDLDFFTGVENVIRPFSLSLEKELKKELNAKVVRRFETFVEFEVKEGNESTVVQLAYDSPFKPAEREETNLGILVNGYKDVIVDKTLAFFGRSEPRDAVDLFFILKNEDFLSLTRQCKEKDEGFDMYWMAVALSKVKGFPDELDRWPVQMIKQLDVRILQNQFLELSESILKGLENNG